MTTRDLGDMDPAVRQRVKELTGLDPVATLTFFDTFYLEPLSRRLDIGSSTILDCACGTAWLAMAARLRGAPRVVAADLYPSTLDRARAVAALLGLEDEIEFVTADVTRLPFADQEFDAVCSIETLEHVPVVPATRELARVCRQFFVVETINRRFPIDTHDTPYPFAHFLPTALRRRVNLHYGTSELNRYPSWGEVEGALTEFDLLTPFKTFQDPDDWAAAFPYENPYIRGRLVELSQPKWRAKQLYYRSVYGLMGQRGRRALDKITGVYGRREPVAAP